MVDVFAERRERGVAPLSSTLMLFLPEASGPRHPVSATIERRPGSVRRTSSIDTARPDGFRGDLVVTARGRDIRTTSDATSVVIDQVDLSLRVDSSNWQVLSIASSPTLAGLEQLVGARSDPGSGPGSMRRAPVSARRAPCSICCWTTCRGPSWSRVTRRSGPAPSTARHRGPGAMPGTRRAWPGCWPPRTTSAPGGPTTPP